MSYSDFIAKTAMGLDERLEGSPLRHAYVSAAHSHTPKEVLFKEPRFAVTNNAALPNGPGFVPNNSGRGGNGIV